MQCLLVGAHIACLASNHALLPRSCVSFRLASDSAKRRQAGSEDAPLTFCRSRCAIFACPIASGCCLLDVCRRTVPRVPCSTSSRIAFCAHYVCTAHPLSTLFFLRDPKVSGQSCGRWTWLFPLDYIFCIRRAILPCSLPPRAKRHSHTSTRCVDLRCEHTCIYAIN